MLLRVERGHTILEHAATGGTGSLLCQWENALGGIVIGTVSTKKKATQAKEDGFHHVILNNANHRTKVELTKDHISKITIPRSTVSSIGNVISVGEQ
ncbi:hypothetical protein CTI12_AA515190 [Artemisia annua]|uniref:Quinone oxidoreductase n=1 Tax=Artemisia annua TaxID=35608 RepID=A0A2U1L8N8_ARTAN|nr:hypothetical protein CTI12_AA515190 [Artemisia annua]